MALSQRDADGDGYENGFDTCVDKANAEWKPRAPDPVNDTDNDGLPNVCDPEPTTASAGSPTGCKSGYTGPDHDQDCFANRADNCPVNKSLQDASKPPDQNTNKPFAPDEDRDGIGDVCDPDKTAVNGDYIGYCLKFAINVGGAQGATVGERDAQQAPDCAARIDQTPPPGTSIASATPRPNTGSGGTGGGSGTGVGPSSGVGSLSPTATGFPVWAAILAGLGAAGVISGFALFARVSPRRER
jgi:hypothetical protein